MSLANIQTLAAHSVAAVEAGRNLSDVLAEIWRDHPQLSAQERGALQDIAYGCQRFSGSLRALLGLMLNKPLPRADIRSLILAALYQLAYSRNAAHAVVNEAVRAAGKIGKGQYKAVTNALLRRFLRERDSLMQQAQQSSEGRYNLPDWWLERLQRDYPEHWLQITEAFNSHPPMTLRINRRHGNAEGYLEKLAAEGIAGKVLDEYAVILDEAVPVSRLPGFSDGLVSVQDFGAQQAAYILKPADGERILDACAAPGGKSGHILELANCSLTALDIDEGRLKRVADNLSRLGFQTASLHRADAADLSSWYDGNPFDAVLADVPCTASGVTKRNPDIKWLRRPADGGKTARQQETMLDNLWSVLKPGGRMLLATCSLFHEENDGQLQRFLRRHPDAACTESLTLLPKHTQDGFYYALIRKQP